MGKSIISNERACLVCGNTINLHRHHIYEGVGRRKLSEKYNCWCFLCHRHHNGSNVGVHYNKVLDRKLKQQGQKAFEFHYPDLDFVKIFGKNYL